MPRSMIDQHLPTQVCQCMEAANWHVHRVPREVVRELTRSEVSLLRWQRLPVIDHGPQVLAYSPLALGASCTHGRTSPHHTTGVWVEEHVLGDCPEFVIAAQVFVIAAQCLQSTGESCGRKTQAPACDSRTVGSKANGQCSQDARSCCHRSVKEMGSAALPWRARRPPRVGRPVHARASSASGGGARAEPCNHRHV